jgi:DNA adenine methylase
VLAALQPPQAVASDVFGSLMEIWQTLQSDPDKVVEWYFMRYKEYFAYEKPKGYELIRMRYNARPNGADLLFLCRSCYGGVMRFRKADGHMSTPCGPITPESFSHRVQTWRRRVAGTRFVQMDFSEAMRQAQDRDLVYCDPPHTHSQGILYRGQDFELARLMDEISGCKDRGVRVALSIDGNKKSGQVQCHLDIPDGLFKREVFVNCGRSMLRRFQREGESLEDEVVHDRLLLTY